MWIAATLFLPPDTPSSQCTVIGGRRDSGSGRWSGSLNIPKGNFKRATIHEREPFPVFERYSLVDVPMGVPVAEVMPVHGFVSRRVGVRVHTSLSQSPASMPRGYIPSGEPTLLPIHFQTITFPCSRMSFNLRPVSKRELVDVVHIHGELSGVGPAGIAVIQPCIVGTHSRFVKIERAGGAEP